MSINRIAWRDYYNEAVRLIGAALVGGPTLSETVHKQAAEHASRALSAENTLFLAEELDIEALRKLTADQGETISALQAENRDQERDLQVCDEGFEDLAQALWGDEAGRPKLTLTCEVGVLANWRQLRDRHVAQMVSAVRQIEQAKSGQRGAVAAELAETQKQAASLVKEVNTLERHVKDWEKGYDKLYWLLGFTGETLPGLVDTDECIRVLAERIGDNASERQSMLDQLGDRGEVIAERDKALQQLHVALNDARTMEGQPQAHERILDQLWETVHPDQEQDDDAEPEELGRQICEKWADLGREQQQKDRAIEAAGEQTLDGLAELQKRVRELGDNLRRDLAQTSDVDAEHYLNHYADLFGPATPGLLGGNALVEPAELARGKQMGDAIATAIYGEGRG